ncbi:MAG: hypothetical protein H6Q89_3437 [Myxococcaceae bacterium]|nr:hypothetical protein [Myxococcaceae bacterium]
MLLLPLIASLLLATAPRVTVSAVACQSVADCWLDEEAKPIKRPKQHRGKPLPAGDCGKKLKWLRNRLACEQSVCTVTFVGDRC